MKKGLSLSLVALAIIGCGGGGGSSTPTPTTPAPTPNVAPTIADMSVESIMERDSLTFTASASDSDGTVSSYRK